MFVRARFLVLLSCLVLFGTAFLSAQCAPGAPQTVTICSPASGATVTSPVHVTAAAKGNNPVTAMKIYLDGVSVFSTTASTIDTNITATAGTHKLTVKAWDQTNVPWSQSETFTVGSGGGGPCTATGDHTVNICSPTNGSTVASPVTVSAGANASNGVAAMRIYVDNTAVFTQDNTTSINQQVTMSSGAHKITVVAWDPTGASFTNQVNITVTGGTSCAGAGDHTVHICSPANASVVNSPVPIQAVAQAANGVATLKIYLDGGASAVFTTSASSIDTAIAMTTGSHHITVKAWDKASVAFSSAVSFTVQAGSGGSLTISPSSATVSVNGTMQFNASTGNTSVTWSVDGTAGGSSTVGTISTSGLYTAPATTGTHTIGANNASTGQSATATVNVVPIASGGQGVFTYQYDNSRSGANTHETQLTPANVNSTTFGKLATISVDANVFAQPLYVPGVQVGSGTFNVLYIATENDSVYAFNADSPTSPALWKRSFLGNGATIGTGFTGGRTSIGGNVGITGTPVIDPNTNRMYVIVRTTENAQNVQRLHAIDIRNGNDVTAATTIQASVPGSGDGNDGNGHVPFDPLTENQRPALLLSNGVVYVAFASFGDNTPYHGWLIAYDAGSLQMISAYNATPDGDGGGFWQSGAGPAADSSGNVYVASGNAMPNATGLFNPPDDIPNGVLKLKIVGSSLSLVDYFAPFNDKCLTADDLDLGSSGPLMLPDGVGGGNLIVIGSKEGRVYLLNRDNLGKFHAGDDSQIPDSVLINPTACGQSGFNASSPLRIYGSQAYWNGNVYLGSAFSTLRQYNVTGGKLNQVAKGTFTYAASGQAGRGPQPTVSANGNTNGIVWTAWRDQSTGNGFLHAYNASNIGTLLFSSSYGPGASFTTPMVINGRVYVASQAKVYVYGLK